MTVATAGGERCAGVRRSWGMSPLVVMLLAATPGLAALAVEGLVWLIGWLRRRRLTPPTA